MNFIGFICYFVGLRLRILIGMHKTSNPVTWRWRWRYWNDPIERNKRRLSKGR